MLAEPLVLVFAQGLDVHEEIPGDTLSAGRGGKRARVSEESGEVEGVHKGGKVDRASSSFWSGVR